MINRPSNSNTGKYTIFMSSINARNIKTKTCVFPSNSNTGKYTIFMSSVNARNIKTKTCVFHSY